MHEKILVIGANGQIGTVLVPYLKSIYKKDSVIASDLTNPSADQGPFERLDARNKKILATVIRKHRITHVYHLAAVLSAKGETDPLLSWEINIKTLLNVLEVAREFKLKVFVPSSIAVFGANAIKNAALQNSCLHPATVYGVSKAAAENWCLYYQIRYGIDVRSLRYPGVIGFQSLPGGGTTDYAIDMFHKAVSGEKYSCFLKPDTTLPMIYMDDAIRATLQVMEAPKEKITVKTSYNLGAISFSPAELYEEIKLHIPEFMVDYAPDFRQQIAESWPSGIDDSCARADWGWQPKVNLAGMVNDMIGNLSIIHENNEPFVK